MNPLADDDDDDDIVVLELSLMELCENLNRLFGKRWREIGEL